MSLQADLRIASNAVGERYKCLSFTLEMPFKDVNDRPDTKQARLLDLCRDSISRPLLSHGMMAVIIVHVTYSQTLLPPYPAALPSSEEYQH